MLYSTISVELLRHFNISSKDLETAKKIQRQEDIPLPYALVKSKLVDENELISFLSKRFNLPVVDPTLIDIPEEVKGKIPRSLCEKYRCVPFYVRDKYIYLAIAEPDNILAIDDIRFCTGLVPIIHIAPYDSIFKTLGKLEEETSDKEDMESLLADFKDEVDIETKEEEKEDESSILAEASHAPVVKLVNIIVMEAIRRKASDIHIEIYEKEFRVRYRIDGVLFDAMRPPLSMKNAIISRIKVMAKLNIAEKRLPQDGRIKVKTPQGKSVEFRVSTLPTLFGEKVVMRLLDKSALKLDLSQLGMDEYTLKGVKDIIYKPHGIFLVTGPTGSGKTTTLYSILLELNREEVNIMTAEDPVEFSLPGINQVHIKEDIGLTFASALRSFLRQDPDIILVGEIRDSETAEIAIKAALTGHLVLSTLHTNDAPSTVTRLLDMGVEKFLVASSLLGVMAQRLIRTLCPVCKERIEELDEKDILRLGVSKEELEGGNICRPVGCSECNNSGYKGRTGIHELLIVDQEIQELILKGATQMEIRKVAVKQGMKTMRQSAIDKLKAGLTSVDEVVRVTMQY